MDVGGFLSGLGVGGASVETTLGTCHVLQRSDRYDKLLHPWGRIRGS